MLEPPVQGIHVIGFDQQQIRLAVDDFANGLGHPVRGDKYHAGAGLYKTCGTQLG